MEIFQAMYNNMASKEVLSVNGDEELDWQSIFVERGRSGGGGRGFILVLLGN